MESEQGQHFQSGDEPTKNKDQDKKDAIPGISGIPVIRSNTPRPLSFGAMLAASERTTGDQEETSLTWSVFPSQAPSAPPLPEELDDNETIGNEAASSHAPVPAPPESSITFASESQEFVWLFEYGLEMDGTFLNNPQRLDGAALLYGPAVLKGYTLMFAAGTQTTPGQIIVTIMPYTEAGAQVWGVLYRIPRRITLRKNNQPSLLDTTHHAGTPHAVMSATTIVVHEIYREREITCGTYILSETARQQLQLLSPEHPGPALPLLQQLAMLARKQKLPTTYLAISTATTSTTKQITDHTATPSPVEQNTEPLPVVSEKSATSTIDTPASRTSPWLITLATYLLFVLLLVLIFAVAQGLGFGKKVLTPDVTFLGTPWLVLIYGVLGGCISSIVALGRSPRLQPPLFIIVLWFTRPYIGGALSLLVYLFCNSGLFAIAGVAEQHSALFPLIGAVAGLCEGWLFARRR